MGISVCKHPRCDRDSGYPQLTHDGVCEPCRGHVATLLERLVADYVYLKTDMPTPIRRESGVRTKSDPRRGHAAEWASLTTASIATLINTAHRLLAYEIGGGAPPTPKAAETARVDAGYGFLRHRVPELCRLDNVGDFIEQADGIHREIRSRLGLNKRRQHAPMPCPSCTNMTLYRDLEPDREQISCGTCGYAVDPERYGLLARMAIDVILDTNTSETRKVA